MNSTIERSGTDMFHLGPERVRCRNLMADTRVRYKHVTPLPNLFCVGNLSNKIVPSAYIINFIGRYEEFNRKYRLLENKRVRIVTNSYFVLGFDIYENRLSAEITVHCAVTVSSSTAIQYSPILQ